MTLTLHALSLSLSLSLSSLSPVVVVHHRSSLIPFSVVVLLLVVVVGLSGSGLHTVQDQRTVHVHSLAVVGTRLAGLASPRSGSPWYACMTLPVGLAVYTRMTTHVQLDLPTGPKVHFSGRSASFFCMKKNSYVPISTTSTGRIGTNSTFTNPHRGHPPGESIGPDPAPPDRGF